MLPSSSVAATFRSRIASQAAAGTAGLRAAVLFRPLAVALELAMLSAPLLTGGNTRENTRVDAKNSGRAGIRAFLPCERKRTAQDPVPIRTLGGNVSTPAAPSASTSAATRCRATPYSTPPGLAVFGFELAPTVDAHSPTPADHQRADRAKPERDAHTERRPGLAEELPAPLSSRLHSTLTAMHADTPNMPSIWIPVPVDVGSRLRGPARASPPATSARSCARCAGVSSRCERET